ncbi:MAG: hypothetical protein IT282_06575 [Bacteroidetes bacterium]|nr:hypothetical protein [Bacteroidota bacterium]
MALWTFPYVHFSANHVILLHRYESSDSRFSLLVMRDDSTRRVYRLHDFSQAGRDVQHRQHYSVGGKVNSKDRLYLAVESVKPDAKHSSRNSIAGSTDSAEGNAM